jgi:BirA family biotin operon repressor/biotin-[acetyl-CoA-carboxylase] ligase
MAKAIREQLIHALAQGDFVSGQQLGEQIGVSRAAISKHIKVLSEIGLDVFRVTGKGYKLAKPLHLLNEREIIKQMQALDCRTKVEVHSMIDSTNAYLMRKLTTNLESGTACVAEYQSAGRGRRGRQWLSPFGSHIYLSVYWQLEQGIAAAMGLSIVAAIAISNTLKSLYQLDVELKWPNDIYVKGEKLAGILIELEGQSYGPGACVIGIGLNVNMPASSAEVIDQPWTDLSRHIEGELDRNLLVAKLICELRSLLIRHQNSGLSSLLSKWHQLDVFLDQGVTLLTGARQVHGICRGINSQGALMLEVDGKLQPVYGGEVSLRKRNEVTN